MLKIRRRFSWKGEVLSDPVQVGRLHFAMDVLKAHLTVGINSPLERWLTRQRGRRLFRMLRGPEEQMQFEGRWTEVQSAYAAAASQMFESHGLTVPRWASLPPFVGETARRLVPPPTARQAKARRHINDVVASNRNASSQEPAGPASRRLRKIDEEMLRVTLQLRRQVYEE